MRKPVQMIWSGSRFQHKIHLNRRRCALILNGEQLTKTQNRNPLRLRFGINFRLVAYIHIFLLLFLFIFPWFYFINVRVIGVRWIECGQFVTSFVLFLLLQFIIYLQIHILDNMARYRLTRRLCVCHCKWLADVKLSFIPSRKFIVVTGPNWYAMKEMNESQSRETHFVTNWPGR